MNDKELLHGKTLKQWCSQFSITDEEVIAKAEKINNIEPHGLRVFPDGNMWRAIDAKHRGRKEGRVAFADTPDGAIINWAKEYDTEEGAG